nr:MAG TPA: Putative plasmid related protein-helix-helix, DNA BINDING PROTEIN [Caudoviricetes sp.]
MSRCVPRLRELLPLPVASDGFGPFWGFYEGRKKEQDKRRGHRWCLQPVTSARSAGSYRNFPDDRKWGQNSQRESRLRSLSQNTYCHNKKQGARPGKEPLLSRKEKFSLYLTLEKKAIPERRYQEDGGRSLTAFIENAVDFYLDYLSANNAGLFLPASVKSCLDGRWDSWKIACLPCLQTGSGAGHGGWHPR